MECIRCGTQVKDLSTSLSFSGHSRECPSCGALHIRKPNLAWALGGFIVALVAGFIAASFEFFAGFAIFVGVHAAALFVGTLRWGTPGLAFKSELSTSANSAMRIVAIACVAIFGWTWARYAHAAPPSLPTDLMGASRLVWS